MIFYFLVFLISSLLFYIGSNRRYKWNIFILVAIFIPCYVAGARAESIGTDTTVYWGIYDAISTLNYEDFILASFSVEPSFFMISKLSYNLGGVFYLFFIYQLITVVPIYLTAYKYKKQLNMGVVFLVYFCFLYTLSFNIMRQVAAVAILLYGTSFLFDKSKHKIYKYMIFSVIGMLFHSSALIGCIFIFILYKFFYQKGQNLYVVIYIAGLIMMLCAFLYIGPLLANINIGRFSDYGNSYAVQRSSYVSVTELLYRSLFAILIWTASFWKFIDKRYLRFYTMLLITETMIMFLGLYNGFLVRIAVYFTIFHLIGLSLIANSKRLTVSSRIVYNSLIIVFCLIYFYWTIVHNGTNEVIPYKFA